MDMRSLITLTEGLFMEGASYPQTATTDAILRLVQDIHHRPQDMDEGDINFRLWKFKVYEFQDDLPVADLNVPWSVDDDMAEAYAARMKSGEVPPPIVYDLDSDEVLDGGHRITAAKMAGLKTIPAYVGLAHNIDPDYDADDFD